jgi:hypothetical protein
VHFLLNPKHDARRFASLHTIPLAPSADFTGCTEDIPDPKTCPTLALSTNNAVYPGGNPPFEVQTSLYSKVMPIPKSLNEIDLF